MLNFSLTNSKESSGRWTLIILLIISSLQGMAQDRISAVEVSETNANQNLFRSEDVMMSQGSATKPYVLYGNDFRGSGSFYISFNLESRQTVSYQLIDIMGKQLATQGLPGVLDQTYRLEANSISGGTYVVKLLINGKCYTEKIFFTP